uniref:Uncharacterized protein n=1 Tax=Nelumbo nucifera TaxID=4432 RepID=A0A822YU09_NELNU|nr:TPA_asm: hypothetical protein HUJ06_006657 [Nelumbo nucifera]
MVDLRLLVLAPASAAMFPLQFKLKLWVFLKALVLQKLVVSLVKDVFFLVKDILAQVQGLNISFLFCKEIF